MFIINWGELEGRTDVEFYVPSVLKYIERLKGMEHQKLLFISQKLANGSTPSEGRFQQNGVLYYRSQDIGLMEMQKNQYISDEFDEKLSRSRCRTGDVLVAIVGAILGRIGFIEREDQQGNINQNITKITISDSRFLPKFVAVFLDSKLGQIQIYRLSTKTAQSYLNNEQLGKVIIPTVGKSLQNDIIKAIEVAHQEAKKKKSEADELLNSINDYILNALNIALPLKPCYDLANRTFYIHANDMLGGRFDPRKYSLKYKQLLDAIESSPYDRLLLKDVISNGVSGDWGLDDTVSDDDLANNFGSSYLYTRKICDRINLSHYPLIKKYIGNSKYTYFVGIFEHLLREGLIEDKPECVDIIIQKLSDINTALRESGIANVTENIAVLGAMTFYKLQDQAKYRSFINWVQKNNIGIADKLHINARR